MSNGYFECGMKDKIVYFDMFYRDNPDNGGYAGVALQFIKAKATGKPVQMVLSVPNDGAIDFQAG